MSFIKQACLLSVLLTSALTSPLAMANHDDNWLSVVTHDGVTVETVSAEPSLYHYAYKVVSGQSGAVTDLDLHSTGKPCDDGSQWSGILLELTAKRGQQLLNQGTICPPTSVGPTTLDISGSQSSLQVSLNGHTSDNSPMFFKWNLNMSVSQP